MLSTKERTNSYQRAAVKAAAPANKGQAAVEAGWLSGATAHHLQGQSCTMLTPSIGKRCAVLNAGGACCGPLLHHMQPHKQLQLDFSGWLCASVTRCLQ